MDAAQQWAEIAAPWREAAERHGFRLLKRSVSRIRGGHRCVDHLLSGPTFLDLSGELGETHGFWSAKLATWIDSGEARFALTTLGEKHPPPRPRGAAGWLAAHLVAPLMRRLAPPEARPLPLRAPADLERLIANHAGEILAIGGKPVLFEGDPLEARFAQERRDARES